ncbi:MAG TPA: hypothetical protein VIC26_03950 [Marinagarivorans sp.]
MADKDFIRQRINVYAGREIEPDSDDDVQRLLREKFNIHLPQRASFLDSLTSANSRHDILDLLIEYRQLK